MTSATAIVSPIARPRPSITAPTMPPRTRGNTATRIISHRVAPMRERGVLVVLRDGGEHLAADSDVTIGVIMMARMRPAVMKLAPLRRAAEEASRAPGCSPTASAIDS